LCCLCVGARPGPAQVPELPITERHQFVPRAPSAAPLPNGFSGRHQQFARIHISCSERFTSIAHAIGSLTLASRIERSYPHSLTRRTSFGAAAVRERQQQPPFLGRQGTSRSPRREADDRRGRPISDDLEPVGGIGSGSQLPLRGSLLLVGRAW